MLALLEKFNTFFGLKFSHLLFSGTEQLSISLQRKNITIQELLSAVELSIQYLQRLRSDNSFDAFYEQVVEEAKELTDPPVLPRFRQPPRKLDSGSTSHRFSTPKCYFRKQYFEVLDLLVNELKRRFKQERGMPIAAAIEKLLLESCDNTSIRDIQLPQEMQLYKNDVILPRLKIQLYMLPDLIRTWNQKKETAIPIRKVTNVRTKCDVLNNTPSSKDMFSEVCRLIQIFYTIPVTTSTAERSFSALRRLKSFLRSTMTQPRLNHLMLLYTHREKTDELDIVNIAKEFIDKNERRRTYFGTIL